MLSVMNSNEYELERKDNIEVDDKAQPKSRVSSDLSASEENRVSGNDDDVYTPVSDTYRGDDEGKAKSFEVSDKIRVPSEPHNRSTVSDVNNLDDWNRRKAHEERGKSGVSEYESMLSMFDEFAASKKGRVTGSRQSSSVGYGYEVGDMVWGKVKSHPWWPGHIYDEAFASPSVRRLKKNGLVLVAFFGDSSYGWFDPAELIPFEPHFLEKSKQINSKTFIKAVEEAADEASRRRGLGLACRCRNPFSFRPASVQGYFAVDVGDYEPAAIYSIDQIRKARDNFQGSDTLAFMKQLALIPRRDGHGSLDFIKDKAAVLAYRRAVYEEFDETYAQAFGHQPVRPTVESREVMMQSVRAPLSGPMVIAETLGKKKTPTKSNKAKDQAIKDKYLFKRRDEANELKSQQTKQATSSMQPLYIDGSVELADGDYVLQRRAPPISPDQQTSAKKVVTIEEVTAREGKPSAMNGYKVELPGSYGERYLDPAKVDVSLTTQDEEAKFSSKGDQKTVITSKLVEGHQRAIFHDQDSKFHAGTGTKKAKILKRPPGDMGADRSATGEKRKKRKKESGIEMSSDRMQKLGPAEKGGLSGGKVTGKPVKVKIEHQKKDDQDSDSLPNSVRKFEVKLVNLLGDLHLLALNPFHGRERNSPAFIRQAFLKFRSLVFQKSLALSPPSDLEPNENYALKFPASSSLSSDILRASVKDQLSSKPPKPLVRPEDSTKVGRKRSPSDRQEELAAKRLKKVNDLKSLTVDKKTALRTPDVPRDGRDSVVTRPQKPLRAEPGKKMEAPPKAREPTLLVMKFPLQSTLPSENELKARLARFGPLDHSRTRIFWRSFTCRVVFIYKADAEAAYRHLTGNNNVFGNVTVRCHTRSLEVPTPSDLESKAQREDAPIENAGEIRPPSAQLAVQIKSCLKKPMAGEAGPAMGGNGGSKGTARVKFVLGGGENSVGEQLMNKNNFNNTSFADGGVGASSSSFGMDFNSKNFQQKVVPQNPSSNLHSLPVTSQFPNATINFHYPQATSTNTRNFNPNMAGVAQVGPSSTNIDIAQEMLSLLTKCNDVVTSVKNYLGYVPYHPL